MKSLLPPTRLTVVMALVMLLAGCVTPRLEHLVCERDPIDDDRLICTTVTSGDPIVGDLRPANWPVRDLVAGR